MQVSGCKSGQHWIALCSKNEKRYMYNNAVVVDYLMQSIFSLTEISVQIALIKITLNTIADSLLFV